jgi:effector-binding domain-containing protein
MIGAAFIALAMLVGLALWGAKTVAYESPDYRVIRKIDAIEIREYAPYLVAEVVVDGDLESAGNRGFRILATYIAMTSPVTQERARGTKIAMTTPVTQEKTDGQYTIRFMMPSELSRETLPAPKDSRIAIREIPAQTFAAIRYSGTWSKRNYDEHLDILRRGLRAEGLEPIGEPIWARYDPPFKPWFLRRNEILTAFDADTAH